MTKSYITHLITVIFFHALVMMGFWQLSDSNSERQQSLKLGQGILKLKRSSTDSVVEPLAEKRIPTKKNLNSHRPISSEKTVTQNVTPDSNTNSNSVGSLKGKTNELNSYKEELRAMIEKNKYYPAMSRRLGQTGTVVVAFTLLEDGHIIDIRIDRPCRFERLNDSALDAVKKVERFRPIPKELGETKMDIKVPLRFLTI